MGQYRRGRQTGRRGQDAPHLQGAGDPLDGEGVGGVYTEEERRDEAIELSWGNKRTLEPVIGEQEN